MTRAEELQYLKDLVKGAEFEIAVLKGRIADKRKQISDWRDRQIDLIQTTMDLEEDTV